MLRVDTFGSISAYRKRTWEGKRVGYDTHLLYRTLFFRNMEGFDTASDTNS